MKKTKVKIFMIIAIVFFALLYGSGSVNAAEGYTVEFKDEKNYKQKMVVTFDNDIDTEYAKQYGWDVINSKKIQSKESSSKFQAIMSYMSLPMRMADKTSINFEFTTPFAIDISDVKEKVPDFYINAKSNDTSIVKINSDNIIEPVKAGKTIITATNKRKGEVLTWDIEIIDSNNGTNGEKTSGGDTGTTNGEGDSSKDTDESANESNGYTVEFKDEGNYRQKMIVTFEKDIDTEFAKQYGWDVINSKKIQSKESSSKVQVIMSYMSLPMRMADKTSINFEFTTPFAIDISDVKEKVPDFYINAKSNDTSIVKINSNNIIEPVKAGKTTITATDKKQGKVLTWDIEIIGSNKETNVEKTSDENETNKNADSDNNKSNDTKENKNTEVEENKVDNPIETKTSEKDVTQSTKPHPQAGDTMAIFFAIIVVSCIVFVSYKKIKNIRLK